jgi:4-amino-4-deoxy-L-arabinose transferase-like glycosyltransferase
LLAAVVWLSFSAGLRPLTQPDEGRYIGVAWEMLQSGRWAVPTLDGLPFFHKPVLFYWITAAALKLFGANPWAGRMASLVGALLALVPLYFFTRRWCGERLARLSTLVLATQPFFFVGAQFANLDMLVAGCIGATVLLGADAVLRAERGLPHRAVLCGAYAMAALGILAKGLIGGVLPVGVLLAWVLVERRPRALLTLLSASGLLVFLLVGVPWFALMQLRFPDFFHYFFIHHHFQRYASSGFNNEFGAWFYPPVVLLLTLPWSLWLFGALRRRPVAEAAPGPRVGSLMVCWLLAVLVFFSVPRSKLVGYVLPLLPPLAWLLASALQRLSARAIRAWAAAAMLLCLGAVAAAVAFDKRNSEPLAAVLRAQRQAEEPVIYIGHYPYDLALRAGLKKPPPVLEDWALARRENRDNWRQELFEAGDFDPAAAAVQLIDREAAVARLCAAPVGWLVAPRSVVQADPLWRRAQEMAVTKDASLWKLDRAALPCGREPAYAGPGRPKPARVPPGDRFMHS